MHLENVVIDAVDPLVTGPALEERLGTERLTTLPEGVETRLHLPGGAYLDLCVVAVPEAEEEPERLHLDLRPGPTGEELVEIALESADVERDLAVWTWLTAWAPVPGGLRHPSGAGPLLRIVPESAPAGPLKNRAHLDLRLSAENDPDAAAAELVRRGGREVTDDPTLPWRVFEDPSGNVLCMLAAPPVSDGA